MNSTHDNGENGRPLEKDLERIGRAYSQLGGEEPPELLDLAIRNSAHRAVEKKPRRLKFSWMHGLTTAAVFVLALSVIIHQRENQPAVGNGVQFDRLQPPPPSSPAKMQSPADEPGQVSPAMKASADAGTDLATPAAEAPVSEPRGLASGDTPREYRQKVSSKAVQQPEDAVESRAVPPETVQLEEADSGASKDMDSAKAEAGAEAVKASAITAPPPAAAAARASTDARAEEQLRAIISMKQRGDENWKTELETFIENHPGYPLPDELKD